MSHLQKTEKWRTEKRALMLELLDNPRTGLKESSDTNKTRMELLGILDEMEVLAQEATKAERERIEEKLVEPSNWDTWSIERQIGYNLAVAEVISTPTTS